MAPQERLYNAIYSDNPSGVKAAIKAGADVNALNKTSYLQDYNRRPLCHAIFRESPRIVKILLDLGADPKKGTARVRPLHLAAGSIRWSEAFCGMLIAAGANVNAKTREGVTPLHYAAWKHNTNTARLLVNMGAKIDARDKIGRTPLFIATQYLGDAGERVVETIKYLLDAGAKPDRGDFHGVTPRDLAVCTASTSPGIKEIKDLFAARKFKG